jgi:hypothetical protein
MDTVLDPSPPPQLATTIEAISAMKKPANSLLMSLASLNERARVPTISGCSAVPDEPF